MLLALVPLAPSACSGDETDRGTPATDADTDAGAPTGPESLLSALSSAVDPSFGTLVTARWHQSADADVHVEYGFDAGEWLSSPVRPRLAGDHEELLLGIPYDTGVTWRVVAESPDGITTSPDQTSTTGELPETVPPVTVLLDDPSRRDAGTKYVLLSMTAVGGGFGDEWWTLIVDRRGRPVWAGASPDGTITMHPRLSWDGTALLLDRNLWWSDFVLDAGSIDAIRIDGTPVRTWDTPGLHHPYQEMPDGSLAWGAWNGDSYHEVLRIVHPDGSAETLWDCDAFLSDIGSNELCGSNTLDYDEARNTFLYTFFSFDSVVEIDATTGETLRWFGDLPGSYAFDPPGNAFFWPHGGHWTDSGTLLLSSQVSDDSDELVIREYEVDPATETLHQVFAFGQGQGLFAFEMGDAYELPGGNILHNYGSAGRLREVTRTGEVVWDLAWGSRLGRSTGLSDLYVLAPVPE